MDVDVHNQQRNPPAQTSAAERMSALEREAERDRDESVSAWAFLWVLFAFKIVTVALIFWKDVTYGAGMLIGATTWYWSILPLAAAVGPVLYRLRLRRQRRRRRLLIQKEWLLPGDGAAGD